jgi:hypothetical protein
MSRRLFAGWAFVAASVGLTGSLPGQDPAGEVIPKDVKELVKKIAEADGDAEEKKYPDFAKVVKGAKVTEGLLTLHQKDDHVYAELQPQNLDRQYLLPVAVAKGAGMGGSTLNFGEEWVVTFKRVGDRVFLTRKNVRFTAKPGSPAAKAVDTTYADSVLMALPIKALNPAKSSVLIDLNQIFFTDFAELGLGYLDRERTTWHKVKNFKKNVELQVAATFSPGRYGYFSSGGGDVIDARGVSVVIQYGLVEMPDGGYQPRYADTRVGHFLSAVKDFSKDNPDTSFVRMVNRWRLERADGSPWKDGAKLVPPKKKIVFWIEDSVPDEYRAAVRDGILEWNKAFEKVGFRDAIEVRQQQGEEFDPEDITYATFRWTAGDTGGAIGPSRANPLTGEILDADILFDGGFIRYYRAEQATYRDDKGRPVVPASTIRAAHRGWEVPAGPLALRGVPAGWDDRAKAGDPRAWAELRAWQRANHAPPCRCAAHARGEMAMAALALAAAGATKDGEKLPDELIQQAVKEITMHEVGHTLGLRHNFKASTMLPNDKLHDTETTRKVGLVGSVMDYSPVNIAPKGAKQGDFFTTTLGPYDYWAIEYAYKPLTGGADGEKEELNKVASKVADPKLTYATDEDLYAGPDPLVNLWDLGADPVRFGKDRLRLAQETFATLADKAVDKGEGYARLRPAFQLLLRQYGNAAYLSCRQVGGVAVHRDHKGDPNGRDPLVPAKAETQREALKYLRETVLTDKPFAFPPDLLRKLAPEKWYHWGETGWMFGPSDFPVNDWVLSIQSVVLDELLDPGALKRVQNNARTADKGEDPLTLAEVFRTLTDGVWADLPDADGKAAGAKSSVVGRNLQRAHLAKLSELVLGPKPDPWVFVFSFGGDAGPAPADAKSLARMHLREVGRRVDAALKVEKDDVTKAHLEETKERIAKVLAATVTANDP